VKYLTLSADYLRPNLRDEDPDVDLDPLQALSDRLAAEIVGWNDRYQVVVSMDMPARVSAADLIGELDRNGLDLATRIEQELRPARVRYYSEGLMGYLP
jgi:hypothetical protein